ncbi:sorting nexin-16 [Schistocerca cancellata]|uniref:sorting nexin-16 n=1 Tax=Schistocerca cancellata TaxID=274614 RepID=UPI0021182AA2|nr:sorting nexin-16 [Schistocerca cancellata]XP_049784892.1 sorting nexin-16 [Schistocerca cancellata]
MAADSSPCVSEVTSAISRIRMGNNSDTKGPRVENDVRTPSSSPQSPETPVLDITENHVVDSFRLRMINSASNCSSPNRENTKAVSDIQIPIVGYEVMEERARFTVYKLRIENKASGNCWYVFRRYTDFVRLHSKLRSEFPDVKLQLPRKRWFGDNFDPAFLSDRIKGLQGFVNAILNHQELCSAQAVKDFFCLDEPPSYTESLEESRAIFEALEETIYHLRSQLREKETELTRMKFTLDIEMKKNNRMVQLVRTAVEKCTTCSRVLPVLDGPNLTSTPVKAADKTSVGPRAEMQTSAGERSSAGSHR